MNQEIWKDIKGYEGLYEISNLGRVRSIYRKNKYKKYHIDKLNNVALIQLNKDKKVRSFCLATLLVDTFTLEELKDIPNELRLKSSNVFTYGGKTYKSYNELAREKNINCKTFIHRIEAGWTLEEAVSYVRTRKKTHNRRKWEYKGKLYTYEELSKLSPYKVRTEIILSRLYRGWTVEEAIGVPIKRDVYRLNVALYEYNGKLCSIKELIKLATNNIKECTLRTRIKNGWDIESALTIPVSPAMNSKKK